MVSKLLKGWFSQWPFNPEIRSQVTVGLGHGRKGGFGCTSMQGGMTMVTKDTMCSVLTEPYMQPLTKVAQSSGGASSTCPAVFNTCHLQQLLGHRGWHNSSASGCRNEAHQHRSTFACHLCRKTHAPCNVKHHYRDTLIWDRTLQGTVWGWPILLPQYPTRTGMTESLASMIAPLMAVATSLEHLTPSPTCLLLSPIATIALNRVLCPALVCFCTGMIFITSSLRELPKKWSMISVSYTEKA